MKLFLSLFLETLKLNFKVYLTQATSHGCHDLHDQIHIPRRLPRTRPSTKKPRRLKSKKKHHRTTIATEYHCRKRILSDTCGNWNESLRMINRTVCHRAFQYTQCLKPLKLKCQNLMSNHDQLSEIEQFLKTCYQTFVKARTSRINRFQSNFIVILSILFVTF